MDNSERREKIVSLLMEKPVPVSASKLASKLDVSRQIIVGDVALLRAEGHDIVSTPRGYVYGEMPDGYTRRIACRHEADGTREELYILVDAGCTVEDVIIEHPVYGELVGTLQLSSRYDVDEFMDKLSEQKAAPLSALTYGIHLHTIRADSKKKLDKAVEKLRESGFIYEE